MSNGSISNKNERVVSTSNGIGRTMSVNQGMLWFTQTLYLTWHWIACLLIWHVHILKYSEMLWSFGRIYQYKYHETKPKKLCCHVGIYTAINQTYLHNIAPTPTRTHAHTRTHTRTHTHTHAHTYYIHHHSCSQTLLITTLLGYNI